MEDDLTPNINLYILFHCSPYSTYMKNFGPQSLRSHISNGLHL